MRRKEYNMGLLKAAFTAASGNLADQWLEYFVCDSIPADTLVVRATKRTGKGSSNTKGGADVISNGSGIVVNPGQAAILVDSGVITEIAVTPGNYTYDSSASPSFFSSSFGQGIKDMFKDMWDRIKHGGDAAKYQRIYFFNMKEIIDNKFGTQNPVPFRVTYQDLGRSFTVGVRCNGVFSYKITDPSLFYQNVCGNVNGNYSRTEIDGQIKAEFLNNLQPAFAKLSNGIRYDELPGHTVELTDAMNEALTKLWKEKRGIEVESVAINSVTVSDEDVKRIQEFEDRAWNRDPGNAAATMVEAQAAAMTAAAGNAGGAAMGFFGMNMAQQTGGLNAQNLFGMAAQNQAAQAQAASAAAAAGTWTCACGTSNTGKFCENCGKPRPAADGWTCEQFGEEAQATVTHTSDAQTTVLTAKFTGMGTVSFTWAVTGSNESSEFRCTGGDSELVKTGPFSQVAQSVTLSTPGEHLVSWVFKGRNTAIVRDVAFTPTDESLQVTQTTVVPIPFADINRLANDIWKAQGGDYEAAANAMAANGRTVMENCITGVDSSDPEAEFTVKIKVVDGVAKISWTPALNGEIDHEGVPTGIRTYTVYGTDSIETPNWQLVTPEKKPSMRFFKVSFVAAGRKRSSRRTDRTDRSLVASLLEANGRGYLGRHPEMTSL